MFQASIGFQKEGFAFVALCTYTPVAVPPPTQAAHA
jgi:hypothetical protein